jgi:hypothetical protein
VAPHSAGSKARSRAGISGGGGGHRGLTRPP